MFLEFLLLATVTTAPVISLDDAINTALTQAPVMRSLQAQLRGLDAQAVQARAGLLPQVIGSARGEFGSQQVVTGLPGTLGTTLTANVFADQLLWDFNKTWNRWKAAETNTLSFEETARELRLELILDVRLAYFQLQLRDALVDVADTLVANQTQQLKTVETFVTAGVRPPIDVAKVRTALAAGRAALARAEGDRRIANIRLNLAMGVRDSDVSRTDYDTLGPVRGESTSTSRLFSQASGGRPELAALRTTLQARELEQQAAEAQLWPSLHLVAGASALSLEGFEPAAGASVALVASWNIFDGFASPAQADAARAAVDVQKATLDGRAQEIWVEIEEAKTLVESAKAELESNEIAVAAALDLFKLAQQRSDAGLGDAVELSDGQLQVAQAMAARARVGFELATARARLSRAVGNER